MKERPILFSAPMVRAILAGTKTQTRRVVKHTHAPNLPSEIQEQRELLGKPYCPYGDAGDRLWVRETHFINDYRGVKVPESERGDCEIMYRATDEKIIANWEDDEGLVWKPSIHMPRWASRILLEIVSVRCERLQDISEDEAKAEGVSPVIEHSRDVYEGFAPQTQHKEAFKLLWESINGPGSWNANPFVWAVEFKRVINA